MLPHKKKSFCGKSFKHSIKLKNPFQKEFNSFEIFSHHSFLKFFNNKKIQKVPQIELFEVLKWKKSIFASPQKKVFLWKRSFNPFFPQFSTSIFFSFPQWSVYIAILRFKMVQFIIRFLDCCSGWFSSLITKSKIEKNTKLVANYLIGVSDISKGFDYFDCNTAFCPGCVKYSNYCGGSYVDFLKWMSWLAQVSPTFETTIKVDTNSPQIDHKKKKYFNLSEQTKKEVTFFSSVCWKVSSGIGESSTYPQFWIWEEVLEEGSFWYLDPGKLQNLQSNKTFPPLLRPLIFNKKKPLVGQVETLCSQGKQGYSCLLQLCLPFPNQGDLFVRSNSCGEPWDPSTSLTLCPLLLLKDYLLVLSKKELLDSLLNEVFVFIRENDFPATNQAILEKLNPSKPLNPRDVFELVHSRLLIKEKIQLDRVDSLFPSSDYLFVKALNTDCHLPWQKSTNQKASKEFQQGKEMPKRKRKEKSAWETSPLPSMIPKRPQTAHPQNNKKQTPKPSLCPTWHNHLEDYIFDSLPNEKKQKKANMNKETDHSLPATSSPWGFPLPQSPELQQSPSPTETDQSLQPEKPVSSQLILHSPSTKMKQSQLNTNPLTFEPMISNIPTLDHIQQFHSNSTSSDPID